MRNVFLALLLVLTLALVAGCSGTDEAAEPTEPTSTAEATASAAAVAPDLIALVGESSLTAENAEASGGSIHYGDAALMDEYQAKAQEFGLTVEFTVLADDDETFMHGMAGWPIGQDPEPGMQVDAGSAIQLVVIEATEVETVSSSTEQAYTPEKGSAERTAIMDACRSYLAYDGLFIIDELKVKGDRAYAAIMPESGGDILALYLAQPSGSWRVSYCIYPYGGVEDGNKQQIGEFDPDYMSEPVYNEIANWLQ